MDLIETTKFNTIRFIELRPGVKIIYPNKKSCLEISEELTNRNIKNRIGYNPDNGFWSVAIIE